MPRIQHLDNIAQEEGTYPVRFTFKDSLRQEIDASAIVSINWWLSDMTGTIINSRSQVVVSEIINPYYLVLQGDDLQILDKDAGYEERLITLRGIYNSDLGNGFPFTYAVSFSLLNNLIVASHLNIEVVDVIFAGDLVYV
ncbi:MAG: hypothetical protein KAS32_01100 [Candidatus Peribacteraceae bacterium]|nr:hypothetical protein [Candidatus Peribacteraceae bacterium]